VSLVHDLSRELWTRQVGKVPPLPSLPLGDSLCCYPGDLVSFFGFPFFSLRLHYGVASTPEDPLWVSVDMTRRAGATRAWAGAHIRVPGFSMVGVKSMV